MTHSVAYRLLPLIALGSLLGACGGAPERQPLEAPSIATLINSPVPVTTQPDELPDAQQRAVSAYRDLLEQPDARLGSAEVRRRLADLQVEAAESGGAADAARYREAIALYRGLLAEQPEAEREIAIRYQLAKALALAGQADAARAELDLLAARHPNAEAIDEVQFRRGEMNFRDGDYARAEAAYSKVIALGEGGEFYPRALYKRGWARFKQSDYGHAENDFSALLQRSLPVNVEGEQALAELPRGQRELLGDSLRAMALSFGYEGGAPAADDFFVARGAQPWEDLVYATMATQAREKEQYAEAAAANAAFVARHPDSRRAPFFQMQLVQAYGEAGFDDEVLAAKRDYVALYETQAAGWRYDDPARGATIDNTLELYLGELAGHHHALAQQAELPESEAATTARGEAIDWYRRYLEHFPVAERSAEMNFLLAEALFEQRDFRAAADEYQRAAYDYPGFERADEAGYAALLAFDKHQRRLPPLPERGQPADGQSVDWRLAGIDAALRFAEAHPEHPQTTIVLTRAAEDLFRLGEDPLAQRVAQDVIALSEDGELQRKAWRVSAHVDFDAARYAEAETGYAEVLARLPEADPARAELDELRAASIYRQGEASREAGDTESAVGHFLRVAALVPTASIRVTASYDAAALLYSTADWGRAADTLKQFRADHPEHELAADAGRKLALAYQNNGDTALAADEFRRLGREDSEPALRGEAARQAAALYRELGDRAAALAQYEEVLARHAPDFAESLALHETLLELSIESGEAAGLRRWRESLIALDGGAGDSRTARSQQLAAESALALAKPTLAAYHAVALKPPLEQSLPRKQKTLEVSLAGYGRAAGYGLVPVASEATFRIGELYASFAKSLMSAEPPAGLSELELEQYEVLLEEQAFPLEEEAIAAHELNTARLPDGVWDEWTRGSLAALGELQPGRYLKSEKGAVYVDALD